MTESRNHVICPNCSNIIGVKDSVHIFVSFKFNSAVYPRLDVAVIGSIQCIQALF